MNCELIIIVEKLDIIFDVKESETKSLHLTSIFMIPSKNLSGAVPGGSKVGGRCQATNIGLVENVSGGCEANRGHHF